MGSTPSLSRPRPGSGFQRGLNERHARKRTAFSRRFARLTSRRGDVATPAIIEWNPRCNNPPGRRRQQRRQQHQQHQQHQQQHREQEVQQQRAQGELNPQIDRQQHSKMASGLCGDVEAYLQAALRRVWTATKRSSKPCFPSKPRSQRQWMESPTVPRGLQSELKDTKR